MILAGFFLAMVVSMVSLAALLRTPARFRLLAAPGQRKVHASATPQFGGVGIYLGLVAACLVVVPWIDGIAGFLLGASTVFVMGLIDDQLDLDYRIKFLVQFLAAAVGVLALGVGLQLSWVPDALHTELLVAELLVAVVLVVGLVVVVNAINLSDGLDGLAGGLTLLSGIALAHLAFEGERALPLALAAFLCGGVLGFLRFNDHPAVMFMGDNGAYLLGFTLGFAGLALCIGEDAVNPLALICLIGLPLYDVGAVVVRRLVAGGSPFRPDQRHFHHRMMQLGLRHAQAVLAGYIVHVAFVAVGVLMARAGPTEILLVFCGLVGLVEFLQRPRIAGSLLAASRHFRGVSLPAPAHAVDLLTAAGLATVVAVATLGADSVGADFVLVSAICLVALVVAYRLRDAQRALWLERIALYVLGSYAVYFCAAASAFDGWLRFVELGAFGVLLGCVILRVLPTRSSAFNLTPLDFLVLLAAAAAALLGVAGVSELVPSVLRLVIWFYAVELLLERTRLHGVVWLVAVAGFALLPLRALYDAF